MIYEDEDPDKGQNGLDDAKDSCGKEAGVGALDANAAEDCGGVVVDGVDTRA